MTVPAPVVSVGVDLANPGQFFACCGLLELADRLWLGAEGWFSSTTFHLAPIDAKTATAGALLQAISKCVLRNTMDLNDIRRLEELAGIPGKKQTDAEKAERKGLEKLRREEPLFLEAPFNLQIDWFLDDRAGGSRFKTWAGQQSVIDIALAMKGPIERGEWNGLSPKDWLTHACGDGVPFNFDSNLGVQSSARDVGFSLDPLQIGSKPRPFLELLAFVGLQRFRPCVRQTRNRYSYSAWGIPLLPPAAAIAAAGFIPAASEAAFEFPLLYRTQYLKSFLPATPL